ncbi:MAG TPA: hypothetical protein VF148_02835 [Acidimicrobiia bacterium]
MFSTSPLKLLSDGSSLLADPNEIGFDEHDLDILTGASIYRAADSDGLTAYVARLEDGSLCLIATSAADGGAMTCGTMDSVAAGRLVLRSQNQPGDPSLFVGIAPNDVIDVQVDGTSTFLANNVFVGSGLPTTDEYSLTGESGQRVTVDMNVDGVLNEQPGSHPGDEPLAND